MGKQGDTYLQTVHPLSLQHSVTVTSDCLQVLEKASRVMSVTGAGLFSILHWNSNINIPLYVFFFFKHVKLLTFFSFSHGHINDKL